jgi:hypothetical protein
MPGSTPIYGFPYPEPTDLVADYPALGQQLAEDIEDVLPTIGGLAPATPTSIANSGGSASLSGNTVTFTGVSSVSLNGCFTGTYTNYRVLVDMTSASVADTIINWRFRGGGSDNTTSNYSSIGYYTSFAAAVGPQSQVQSGSAGQIGYGNSPCTWSLDIHMPQVAQITHTNGLWVHPNYGQSIFGKFNATTQFDGFTIYPASGTITGTLSVYGYKK